MSVSRAEQLARLLGSVSMSFSLMSRVCSRVSWPISLGSAVSRFPTNALTFKRGRKQGGYWFTPQKERLEGGAVAEAGREPREAVVGGVEEGKAGEAGEVGWEVDEAVGVDVEDGEGVGELAQPLLVPVLLLEGVEAVSVEEHNLKNTSVRIQPAFERRPCGPFSEGPCRGCRIRTGARPCRTPRDRQSPWASSSPGPIQVDRWKRTGGRGRRKPVEAGPPSEVCPPWTASS